MTDWATWIKDLIDTLKTKLEAGSISGIEEIAKTLILDPGETNFPRIDIMFPTDVIGDPESSNSYRDHGVIIPVVVSASKLTIEEDLDNTIDLVGAVYDLVKAETTDQLDGKCSRIAVADIRPRIDEYPKRHVARIILAVSVWKMED